MLDPSMLHLRATGFAPLTSTGDRRTSGGRNILDRERFRPENQIVGHSECFFDFGFEPDRREAAACRHLNANAVAEDECPGDVIQRQNATTPTRATVPPAARFRPPGSSDLNP